MSPEQMDRFSEDRFRRADTNGDGLLQVNEISERMRPVWEKFDTNHDGAIDLNEFKSYMRSVFQEGQPGRTAEAQPPASVQPMIPVPENTFRIPGPVPPMTLYDEPAFRSIPIFIFGTRARPDGDKPTMLL